MNKKILLGFLLVLLLPVTACSPSSDSTSSSGNGAQVQSFTTGAIPDQDPEKLQRLYGKLAAYLEAELKVPVEYKPVIDYAAAVTAFRVGDLDLVWFGGLTGVQARLQVEEAEAIAQRDIDAEFHTVFIANKSSGLKPIKDIKDLKVLKGHTLTFGSESSTSGRLMPQYFLEQAGVTLDDFKGEVGFSKSHDATIQLVEAGSYKVGALNEQVWKSRVAAGNVDLKKVELIWRTPAYYDYHWVINPKVKERYGDDFVERVQAALLKLDPNVPEQKEILDLFGATKFISTKNDNYAQIEKIGRKIGKIK
ncbi:MULTISPECIES: putative selenate ABC transporter substrate-binding protein [Moorena]|uniref:Putative selenate ABC transporter substrate-binding protein n=1 Tax=Moorena producens PAL-8-15-08-1 TaxID=1458985 RepID=A0A1D8TNK3_9CYAN|nr:MULTISPECIES: putative selenate ABC transporter substrate-binding protein [Moorena]AOW99240.1 putative selenate ABC transporter substrate-binding protein [Moorena producens PAL-8-15-08-1]NEO21483.1 putative selenate ABC transporter substrate-binding protein [Moorena sp. SIO4A5]NEP22371.1 putative selenate ABC transporter substrate-binding protein [Moorena sp. SIO3I6]NEQ56508.1 putative selenate ABC transporter substrate-binding protein [Moorena sp. SIO4A1]